MPTKNTTTEKQVTSPEETEKKTKSKKEQPKKEARVFTRPDKRHAVMDASLVARPIFTEKSLSLAAVNQYVFEVANDANKISVKKAVYNLYGHMPVAVNILNQKGKVVRYGRTEGARKDWKKAIVTLPKGVSIAPDIA